MNESGAALVVSLLLLLVLTAMLVGAAHLLDRHRDALAGDVLFMFQPGEEGFAGARVMLDEGLIDPASVSRAFALHIDPRIPVGRVASRAGAVCAVTRPLGLSTLIKRLELDAWRVPCP